MGGLFQLFWGRGGDFQELGYCPLFDLLWSASELSWRLWVCHLTCCWITVSVYKAQGLVEADSFATLDLVGSNQFMSCPQWLSFF